MGVILEPILQPSRCAETKACLWIESVVEETWERDSKEKDSNARLPKSTMGKLFITLEPKADRKPMLKICVKIECLARDSNII